MLTILFSPEDENSDKKEKRDKQFSIASTLYGMSHFYTTDEQHVFKEALTLCEHLHKDHEGEHSELVLIQPDHHRCYFYNQYFDHKKIIKFLKEKEKSMLKLFDSSSLSMARFYKLSIVVLFIDSVEDFKFWEEYEILAEKLHKMFFFTYVTMETY